MTFRDADRRRRRTDVVIDITALVDIVFQLIIFFVLTTTFVTNPGIEVDLPRAKAHEVQRDTREVVVVLTREGQTIVHGRAVDDAALAEIFAQAADADPDTTVVLQADREVEHGRVVHVMDMARDKGLAKLAIATQPP